MKISRSKIGKRPSNLTRMKMSNSHKGKPYTSYWKGKTLSENHKRKIAEGSLGRIISPATREKIRLARTGTKRSDETRRKIGLAGAGRRHSDEFKRKMSLRLFGNNHRSGRHFIHTEETRRKISQSHFGIRPGEETRAKFREHRMRQVLPTKDTLIERLVQNGLRERGIAFETHKAIHGQPDVFIGPNICVFSDGCYWHFCPTCNSGKIPDRIQKKNLENDEKVNGRLGDDGYVVLRFWEHEIKKDLVGCLNMVRSRLEPESL
jgi:DNA mismatch endonuclease (patch repair protein)